MSDSDFVRNFHNLEGTTIHQKKKSLFNLLKNLQYTEGLDTVLTTIKPQTYLESLFYVDILIYFRNNSKLLEVLRGGNEVLISKILKCNWFHDFLRQIDPKVLVNELLPLTSYTIRLKILKKLCNTFNESYVDNVFDELLLRYGLPDGLVVISNCSKSKIENVLINNRVDLKHNQLVTLLRKHRDLLELYFDHYKKNDTNYTKFNRKIVKIIAKEDPVYYMKLLKKYNFNEKVGRRISKKILKDQNEIISNYETYKQFVRQDVLIRKLQGKAREVLVKRFPNSVNAHIADHRFSDFLYLPKKHRFAILSDCFRRKYSQSIWNYPTWLDTKTCLSVMSLDEKERYARIKYKLTNDTTFFKYYPPVEAIPLLKNIINVSSKYVDRFTAVKTLFECCLLRDDFQSLEEVLKYFCARHCTGDKDTLRAVVLRTIQDSQKINRLTETHWKYIQEIVAVNRMKRTSESDFLPLRFGYLQFLYDNNKSRDGEMDLLFYDIRGYVCCCECENIKEPQLEREIICFGIKKIAELKAYPEYDNDVTNIYRTHSSYLRYIANFNKKHPNLKIRIEDVPCLIDSLKHIFTTEYYEQNSYCLNGEINEFIHDLIISERTDVENDILHKFSEVYKNCERHYLKDVITRLIFKSPKSEEEKWLLNRYWRHCFDYDFDDDWILKYFPHLILEYIKEFVDCNNGKSSTYLLQLKKYSYLNLDTKCIEYITGLKEEGGNYIRFLSCISSAEDYLKFVEKFIPIREKVNLQDKTETKLYNVQTEIAKNFRNVPSSTVLPSLLKFCCGDFLQPSLQSLYSVILRSQEYLILPYLKVLLGRAVSVRKHAIFIASIVLPQRDVIEMLKNTVATEKNTSNRKHLFAASLKYFRKNPSDELYQMVEGVLKFITNTDVESFEHLSAVSKIPRKYQSKYIQCVLELYEQHEQDNVNIFTYKTQLLQAIDEVIINGFTFDYCKDLINKYFLKPNNLEYLASHFVLTFLKYHTNKQEGLKFVFDIIVKAWNKNEDDTKKLIIKYFDIFFNDAFKLDSSFNNYIINSTTHFIHVFHPITSFRQYCLNNLLILKLKCPEPILENFSKQVYLFEEELLSNLGIESLFLYEYVDCINKFLEQYSMDEKYLFWYNLLKNNAQVNSCLMVIFAIKDYGKPENPSERKMAYYNSIIDIIKQFDNRGVQFQYNLHLKCLN